MEKTLCLIFGLLLLGHAYVVKRTVGTWLFPACLNSLFWFLVTFIPLLLVFDAPVNPLAVLYILAACVAFSIPALFFDWRHAYATNVRLAPERHAIYRSRLLELAFFTLVVISLVCLVAFSVTQGFSIESMVGNIMQTAQDFMAARYDQNVVSNVFSEAANVLGYVGSALGGMVFRNYKSRLMQFAIVVLALLPSLFVMMVEASKGMLFLCIAFFFAGILLHRLNDGKARLLEHKIKLRTIGLYFIILFPIVTMSFLARGLYASGDMQFILKALLRYYVSYSCAQIYAFSDWFSFYIGMPHVQFYAHEPPSYGFYTFMSLFRWFGSTRDVVPGVYAEYFTYGDYVTGNIYTHFRGLIQDYGIPFSLAVMVLAGAVSHFVFYNILVRRFAPVSSSVFVLMVGYIYTSFIISLLIWDSSYAMAATLAFMLLVNGLIVKRSRMTKFSCSTVPDGVVHAPG